MKKIDSAKPTSLYSVYANCMEEVKRRTDVVNGFLTRQCNAMYLQTTAESVALQVRKILELVALASMVANKTEYSRYRQNFYKDWNAKRILKTLKKANPKFYPIPGEQVLNPDTGKVDSVKSVKSGFLTEDDFITLYDACCDILHAENPFSRNQNPIAFLESVPEWMAKIRNLLNHHTIQLTDENKELWGIMKVQLDGKNLRIRKGRWSLSREVHSPF